MNTSDESLLPVNQIPDPFNALRAKYPEAKAIHPVAKLIPPMSPEEFSALVDDIRENGLRHPIILIDGLLFDGKHRELGCLEAGVKPYI